LFIRRGARAVRAADLFLLLDFDGDSADAEQSAVRFDPSNRNRDYLKFRPWELHSFG
jgi:hypothetical protein